MSVQRLSDRKTRRIAVATGLDVLRAWVFSGPDLVFFVTRDHQHGTFSRKSGEWAFDREPTHFSTCNLIDPSAASGYRTQSEEGGADE